MSGSLEQAGGLFTGTIGFFIIVMGVILPWLLVLGLGWLGWRTAAEVGRSRR